MSRVLKRLIFPWFAAVLLTVPAQAGCLVTGENYGVGAAAAVVVEAESGRVLFAQQPDQQLPMASTTKIMTALITLEQPNLDQEFTVDAAAIRVEGSSMGLQEGDTVSLRALAGGMLTASGNDAANAAAVKISGSVPAFVERMNQRASELGLSNTHFETPSGLDGDTHYSTAYDMAMLGRAALQNPDFAEMAGSKRLTLSYGNPPYQRTLANHNRLLSMYDGVIGIKTGFTKRAGRCLVSAAQRDGVTLICVTLNCPDDWNTHMTLYNRYFKMTSRQPLALAEPLSVPVTGGTAAQVSLRQTDELAYTAITGLTGKVTTQVVAPPFLYAPVTEGDIVGKIVYYIEGEPVAESPLAAAGSVSPRPAPPKQGWFSRLFGERAAGTKKE